MCGIAGYFGTEEILKKNIKKTLSLMKNRGPDNQNYNHFNFRNHQIFLLHSRLSIIDLSKRSNQPFRKNQFTIIFNGEIYNYIELKKKLLSLGIKLQTSSDTEVLLNYFILYGENCLRYFEGMWAFAIYDNEKKKLFLSRDRFGEKPLYYSINNNKNIVFGSEIKYLKSILGKNFEVSSKKINQFLSYGYKSLYKNKSTFFNNVNEILPGGFMVIDTKQIKRKKYWEPKIKVDYTSSLNQQIKKTENLLVESMRIRLRSDVPIAFCLSGGIDSNSLARIAVKKFNAKIKTFSIIDSDKRYDESININKTVNELGCDHENIMLKKKTDLSQLSKLIDYHDAPLPTTTAYIGSFLAKKISKEHKVCFTGIGADELFAGYYDHFLQYLYVIRNKKNFLSEKKSWKKYISKNLRNKNFRNFKLYIDNPKTREHIYDHSHELNNFLIKPENYFFKENKYTSDLLKNRMLNEMFYENVPVSLHEDDLNMMYYSVENRSPFLDTNLFNHAMSIPSSRLINNSFSKYILREAMKNIMPDTIRLDRKKMGFNASINSLFDLKNKKLQDFLFERSADIFKIVKREKVMKLFKKKFIPNHLSKFIFTFINLRIFTNKNSII